MISPETPPQLRSADELLRIDASAELSRVTGAWLQGPWQVPAELTRSLIRDGAQKLTIECRRRSVRIVGEGARVSRLHLEALTVAFRRHGVDEDRHRALVELERRGGLPLVWAGGLPAVHMSLDAFSDDGCRRLIVKTGESPVLAGSPDAAATRVEIDLRSPALDPPRVAAWLNTVCRFSPVPIEVNGVEVPRGFPPGLLHVRLRAPLPGFLAVTHRGDSPRLWLLQHGVTSTRATVPGYPAFDAALELGDVVPGPASGAALREAVTPYLTRVVDQAVAVIRRLVSRLPELDETARQRVASLLLEALRLGVDRPAIRREPMIREIESRSGRDRWRSPEQLEDQAASHRHPIHVLEPGEDPRRFALGGGALVVSPQVRLLLAENLGLRLETPPLARSRRGRSLAAPWRWLASRCRPMREIEPGDLDSAGQAVLAGLSRWQLRDDSGRPLQVVLCYGKGRVRRVGRRMITLLVPRDRPAISAAIAMTERHPAWLYVLLLQVLDGFGEPPPELRAEWLRRELRTGVADLSSR